MAEPDWTGLGGNLGGGDAARGVTEGVTPPSGGGTFVYGARSKSATPGILGFYHNGASFVPQASGGQVMGAIQRAGGGGDSDYSVCLFQSLQSALSTAQGYLLGLTEDEEPAHIVLKKGALSDGLSITDPGILRTSSAAFAKLGWLHLRLDVIVQPAGDVRLKVFQNDLTAHTVAAPTWEAIGGMADFIDDVLGVASGSVPFVGGYCGWAHVFAGVVNRTSYVDHLQLTRQV